MKKAYISISFSKRKTMEEEVSAIVCTLANHNISSLIFVDKYTFPISEEKEMMQKAMDEIDDCDLLIAEVSDKGIGIGIEVGYAKAKGKPIIYLRNSTIFS